MARDIEYGYKIPTKEDDGDAWGIILENFMEGMANHTHSDGNSASLSESVEKTTLFFAPPWTPINDGIKDGFFYDVGLPDDSLFIHKKVRDYMLTDGTADGNGWFQAGSILIPFNPSFDWIENGEKQRVYSNVGDLALILMVY